MTTLLFSRVKKENVIRISLTIGMGQNELVFGSKFFGKESLSPEIIDLTLQLESPGYVDNIRSQPYTWDFKNDVPFVATPLKYMLSVIERTPEDKYHISNISVYDLSKYNLPEDEAVVSQGYPGVPWHYNYWKIDRQHCDQIMLQLENSF